MKTFAVSSSVVSITLPSLLTAETFWITIVRKQGLCTAALWTQQSLCPLTRLTLVQKDASRQERDRGQWTLPCMREGALKPVWLPVACVLMRKLSFICSQSSVFSYRIFKHFVLLESPHILLFLSPLHFPVPLQACISPSSFPCPFSYVFYYNPFHASTPTFPTRGPFLLSWLKPTLTSSKVYI